MKFKFYKPKIADDEINYLSADKNKFVCKNGKMVFWKTTNNKFKDKTPHVKGAVVFPFPACDENQVNLPERRRKKFVWDGIVYARFSPKNKRLDVTGWYKYEDVSEYFRELKNHQGRNLEVFIPSKEKALVENLIEKIDPKETEKEDDKSVKKKGLPE